MKILLADDGAATRRLSEEALRRAGHEVLRAVDGAEAWAHWERERPPVVIVNGSLPALDGLELCRRVRAADGGRDAVVIVQTRRYDPQDVAAALAAGADDYLVQPTSAEDLLGRLTIATRRRREHADAVHPPAGDGQTVRVLQHAFNNPLSALIGMLTLGRDAPTLDERGEAIDFALVQARRITALVQGMAAPRG